jgi:glycosyltransferase involved in cell wall biosynthesis
LVSIGLPVFNAGRFLVGALQSIFAQTTADWELIVIDDGSTDQAWTAVDQLCDSRVRAFRDGKHLGLAARLNQINALARGNFVARMDADDLCHPERIERQVAYLRQHPEIDAVSTSLGVLDRRGEVAGWRPALVTHEDICKNPLTGFGFVHGAMLARAEWARRQHYRENNRRCEDWELLMSVCGHSKLANLTDCLYYYREFDSFSLANYARSKAGQVFAEMRLGQAYSRRALFLSAMRHLSHVGIYTCAYAAGTHDWLIRYRSQEPTAEIKGTIEKAVARISSTLLPLRGGLPATPERVASPRELIEMAPFGARRVNSDAYLRTTSVETNIAK